MHAGNPPRMRGLNIGMAIVGGALVVLAIIKSAGFTDVQRDTSTHSPSGCRDFFALFVHFDAGLVEEPGALVASQGSQLRYWEAQLALFSGGRGNAPPSRLTVYATSPLSLGPELAHITVEVIDAYAVLRECGFAEHHIAAIREWKVHTRFSDVLRVCLQATRTRATYVDFDIVLLSPDPSPYEAPFVAVGVWGEKEASLEISNAMFCLLPRQLAALTEYAKALMDRKRQTAETAYHYTEFGPGTFAHTLLRGPAAVGLRLYAEPNPWSNDVAVLGNQTCHYGMNHVHVTGSIRHNIAGWPGGYLRLVDDLRCRVGAAHLALARPLVDCGCRDSDRAPQPF
jgi:hypothetical protein